MKRAFVLTLVSIFAVATVAQVPAAPNAIALPPTPAPPPTLTQDLTELSTLVPLLPIRQVMQRYLLNDEQFQCVVRVYNSQDAFILRMRWNAQPQVIAFNRWYNAQLLLSGGPLELEEAEEFLTFTNTVPYWSNTCFGWQGFMNEFLGYYPQATIRSIIDTKIMQNGIFAQFWARVKSLENLYVTFRSLPEAKRILAELESKGIDVVQLDQFIRSQLDWINAPALVAANTTVAPAIAAPPSTAVVPATPVESTVPVNSVAPVELASPAQI